MLNNILTSATQSLYEISGNYATMILFVALISKIILLPIEIKKKQTEIKKNKLKPYCDKIYQKYEGKKDQQSVDERNIEITEMYNKEGLTLAGNYLPMFLHIFIIFVTYRIISNPLKYICNLSQNAINSIKDVAETMTGFQNLHSVALVNVVRDNFSDFANVMGISSAKGLPDMLAFNGIIDLSTTPHLKPWMPESWLPLLVFVCTCLTAIVNTYVSSYKTSHRDKSPKKQKLITSIVIIVSASLLMFMSTKLPCAIALYWIYYNLFGIAQTLIVKIALKNLEQYEPKISIEATPTIAAK